MKKFLTDSIGHLDLIAWVMVIIFFCSSAILKGGDLHLSFIGAGGVIISMFLIGASIEVMIEIMKNVRGIGTLTGFITNGPEALCLVVGLVANDILFAASTPLGSNFMNPVLLVIATLIAHKAIKTLKTNPVFSITCIVLTAGLAISFFMITATHYLLWVIVTVVITVVLFFKRPKEEENSKKKETAVSKKWFLPAILVLLGAGYFLDPVVSFVAEHSHSSKGLIGFIVLATLTS